MNPRLSVIMPAFNVKDYIEEALKSVLKQSLGDFEFLIYDDGSTDGTHDIIQRFAASDARIQLFCEGHIGYGKLLKRGQQEAEGEYIARMDADDVALPDRFAKQIAFLESHRDHVLVGGQIEEIDPEGDVIGPSPRPTTHEEIQEWLLSGRGGAIVHPAMMMRRESLLHIGGYRADFEPSEDYDLILRMSEIGQVGNLSDVVLRYRLRERSVTNQRAAEQRESVFLALQQAFARRQIEKPIPITESMPAGWTVQGCIFRSDWARSALGHGEYRTAIKNARCGVARYPLSVYAWETMALVASDPRHWIRCLPVRCFAVFMATLLKCIVKCRKAVRRMMVKVPLLWRLVARTK